MVKYKLLEILCFDVSIYALYGPEMQVNYKDKPGESTTIIRPYDWCPISLSTIIEKGKTILVKDSSYVDYFTNFKKWEYYIDPDKIGIHELHRFYKDKWKVTSQRANIATSRAEKPIALTFCPRFHEWEDRERASYRSISRKMSGNVVLLPVANPLDTKPHLEFLLRRCMEIEETPPPSWVGDIEVPGEASLKCEISTANEEFTKAESKVKNLEASLHEVEKYKKLLYDTGLPLQDLSKLTLERLGVITKPSPSTDEFIIEVGGREALVEVKGNSKSVKKDDIAQLIVDLGQYLKDTGKEIKGILIGNAWRHLPLDQRDVKGKPIFTKETIQAAENHNIGLISTVELFNAYCRVVEQPDCRSKIQKKIIGSKGVIRLQD